MGAIKSPEKFVMNTREAKSLSCLVGLYGCVQVIIRIVRTCPSVLLEAPRAKTSADRRKGVIRLSLVEPRTTAPNARPQ